MFVKMAEIDDNTPLNVQFPELTLKPGESWAEQVEETEEPHEIQMTVDSDKKIDFSRYLTKTHILKQWNELNSQSQGICREFDIQLISMLIREMNVLNMDFNTAMFDDDGYNKIQVLEGDILNLRERITCLERENASLTTTVKQLTDSLNNLRDLCRIMNQNMNVLYAKLTQQK